MAETRLADIIEPAKFNAYVLKMTTELSRLVRAGIISMDDAITVAANSGGATVNMPFWNDLANVEPNISSDNPASTSTPQKIAADQDIAVVNYRNQSWSSMDLTSSVAGDDPMARIGDRVANYWVRADQSMLIAMLTGVIADNVANNNGDMVVNLATDAVGAPADAELIGAEAVVNAATTMGDHADDLTAIAMHSVPYSRLQKLDLITYRNETLQGSQQTLPIPMYLGKDVIVDDGCPAVAGTNRVTYTSYLFGRGAIAQGDGTPRVPVEVDRDPDAGDGGGQETLYSRVQKILHPRGIKFNNASVAGKSPTNTEFQNAANWTRVYDRKLIRFAALQTNG